MPGPSGEPTTGPAPVGLAELGLRPLTARSVILSTLLGSHPPRLPVRGLVRVGSLFGIAEGTVRVALSRMAAEGDLIQSDATYQLSPRLLGRQRRQDEARTPPTRPWRGEWELVLLPEGRPNGTDGDALADRLRELRLGELGRQVWLRPDNLVRPHPLEVEVEGGVVLRSTPVADGRSLAWAAWDLAGWAQRAGALVRAMRAVDDPAVRFTLSAAVLRHLRADPLLPEALLPVDWPGHDLRRAYRDFEHELGGLLQAPA